MSFFQRILCASLLLAGCVQSIVPGFADFEGGAISTITNQDGFLFNTVEAATPPSGNNGVPSSATAANLFGIYGQFDVSTDIEGSTAANNGDAFSLGNFITDSTGRSDDGETTYAIGANKVTSSTTPTSALTTLDSAQYVFANGPGSTEINFDGSGQSVVPSSQAGFLLSGTDTDSGKDSQSTILANGVSIAQPGFSFSNGTICAGNGCK